MEVLGRPRLRRLCVRWGPNYLQEKGHIHTTQFLVHVYCGQMAAWMNAPLGTELGLDLGTGHIVLVVVPSQLTAKVAQQPPLFAHVYYGHGRPSQLLLSSCKGCRSFIIVRQMP